MYSYKENINNCGYLNVAKNISMEYVFDFIKINISLLTCTLPLIEKKKKKTPDRENYLSNMASQTV